MWDIATARCVEWLRFEAPVTSVSFSACSSNIATSHVGELGITIWTNRAVFDAVFFEQEPLSPSIIDLPSAVEETQNIDVIADSESESESDSTDSQSISEANSVKVIDKTISVGEVGKNIIKDNIDSEPEPIGDTSITLSAAPRSNWANLSNLDLIRQRNRPKTAPEKPKAAPFFLPGIFFQ